MSNTESMLISTTLYHFIVSLEQEYIMLCDCLRLNITINIINIFNFKYCGVQNTHKEKSSANILR